MIFHLKWTWMGAKCFKSFFAEFLETFESEILAFLPFSCLHMKLKNEWFHESSLHVHKNFKLTLYYIIMRKVRSYYIFFMVSFTEHKTNGSMKSVLRQFFFVGENKKFLFSETEIAQKLCENGLKLVEQTPQNPKTPKPQNPIRRKWFHQIIFSY